MAVRKVSNRGGNTIGRFPSLKLERMVAFESQLERDCIYLLDFEADITWFAEQPLTIAYPHQGQTRHYTPDFHVLKAGQHHLIECKPQKFIAQDDNQRKFQAAQTWCAAQGWTFQVISEAELGGNQRVANVKLLTQFARYAIPLVTQEAIRTFLTHATAPVTIGEVLCQVAPTQPQTLFIPILHMAFHHELVLPLNPALISPASWVGLPPTAPEERYL